MVIAVVGPTGVGKTKLSIELAKKLNGEIINADSTIVYKDLDIATAKPTKKEMENIPHHLINIKNLNENYTVYDYQKDARKCIDEILKKEKTPIIVGGTGLYVKACLYDYKFDKETVQETYDNLTNEELYTKLLSIDKETSIHKNNRKRIIRAINYFYESKKPYSQKEKTNKLLYPTIIIGLTTDRNTLYQRINDRVDTMINNGLIDEAKKIFDLNITSKAVMTPIGYKELFEYFNKKCTLEESIELIKQRSRKYAKRQYTWFNNQMNVNWVQVNFENFDETIKEVLKKIKS